ncbi:MAG TPA: response regulator [Geomonas sp.]|nr:response regulator [Geomonas sp.]
MGDGENLLKELLEVFRGEAQDHLAALGSLLIDLERQEDAAGGKRLVETVFRRMHTLKGAAHAVNLVEVAEGCQELEDLLAELKRGERELDRALFDRLHAGLDAVSAGIFGSEPHPHPIPPLEGEGAQAPAGGRLQAPAGEKGQAPAGGRLQAPAGEGALAPVGRSGQAPAGEKGQAPAGGKGQAPVAEGAQAPFAAGGEDRPASPEAPPLPEGDGRGGGAPPAAGHTHARKKGVLPPEGEPFTPPPAAAEAISLPPGLADLHPPAAERFTAGDTVRVPTRLLESLLLQAEELASAKLAASALVEQAASFASDLTEREAERYRTLDLAREALRRAQPDSREARLAELLEAGCRRERELSGQLRQLSKAGERHLWSLGGLVDPLLQDLKKLHLLPFSSLSSPLAKLVRDLGRELGKEAEFRAAGGEIEADRRILAELREPLLHIIRNMMDHGIEPPAERRLKGKPERGSISIEVRLVDANRAELRVSDDGRGIDHAQLKKAALRLELISEEDAARISDQEALQLVFESGVSTSPLITALSGRGIGLAIVRESLEKLGGHATVHSSPGEGTSFRLSFPLSFAMIEGLLVETAGRSCLLPAANVECTARAAEGEIRSVENRETVLVNGEVVALVPLSRLLELGERGGEEPVRQYVLLSAAGKRIAFSVDEVVGVQEVLVKPLGSQLSRVRNVAGATVLGNGRVVPVLNVGDLFRSALSSAGSGAVRPQVTPARRLSVLIAEDSITSRTLLKNILEASGFEVATAVDGMDALTQLKSGSFDLVVSDVEMPRMDGFQLTAALRREPRFESLPVVLVTGLESRADRERGIEVGANAYLVKSSFDQGGLLEVIEKLT